MSWQTIKVLEFAVPCESDFPGTGNKMLGLNTSKTMGLGNNVHRFCLLWYRLQSHCLNNKYLRGAS